MIEKVFYCGPSDAIQSTSHLAASLGATTARLGTALAMIHVMRVALFRAPVADVRAQLADLLGERTVAGDRIGAKPADRRALNATGRTLIFAVFADHVRETVAALGRAVVAGVDAVFGALVRRIAHVVFPLDQRAQFPGRLDNNVRFKLQGRPCRLLIQIKHTSYRHPPASLVKTVYMQTISPSVRFTVRSVSNIEVLIFTPN